MGQEKKTKKVQDEIFLNINSGSLANIVKYYTLTS